MNEQEMHKKYYRQIFDTLDQEPYAQFLGMKLVELGEGSAVTELVVQEHMLNAHNTVHGAIIFSLADYAFAAASNSYGKTSVGLSTNMHFIAPAFPGDTIRATATEEKRNNKVGFYRIKIENKDALIATMEAVVYRKQQIFVELDEQDQ
ncbi:PaaI family thioesterase [Bacillus massiliigorillae]|uniref:PaaI family thioesterase n=1 Tax=Bacillus massiliigorillae TaxID=1243664 RepID=UPI000399C6D8|nr:hotdog fold thioesterase [Bacillus massiliigorillae]